MKPDQTKGTDSKKTSDGNGAVSGALGAPLRLLTQFAGSGLAERLKLRGPAERLLYRGAKQGFRVADAAARRFKPRPSRDTAERLPTPEQTGLFDLNPTDEQALVRDTMRRFADKALRPVAEEADDACAPPQAILEQSHELGLSMMAVPEALGGVGEHRCRVGSVLIAEDLARGDMGLALATLSPASVAHAIADWGTAAQQARYLPAFAEDALLAASIAVVEPQPLFDPYRLRARATQNPDGGYTVYGTKSMVPLGYSSELFLVAADLIGVGPRLFIVERDTDGLSIEPDKTMGLRSAGLCRLTLDKVALGADALLGEPGRDGFDYGAVIDNARIAWGALAVGQCQAVLDYVIPYCNEREAFGEPITNRQSVAFLIADMAIELEAMRMLVYRAASRADRGADYKREAYLVRVQCARKAMKIGSDGIQLLGGHGFVKDHPVERYYRHLRAVGVMEGGLLV